MHLNSNVLRYCQMAMGPKPNKRGFLSLLRWMHTMDYGTPASAQRV
jgi:hypothetical protein